MTTAFVLSGGGSLGAVQVGMLKALADQGIAPDLLIGTSAGALNAGWVAGHGMDEHSLEELGRIWRGRRRRDVFPVDPLRSMLAVVGARPSLCSAEPLRRLVADHLPFARLEDAALPVHVVTTDLLSGQEVLLSTGDAVDAVVASAAIPGVFPPVEVDGRMLCDGGVADNAAVTQAIALGADRVVVLPAGTACALERPPRSAVGTAVHALTLLIEQRLILEVTAYAEIADLMVLPPLCPLNVSAADFGHAGELIDRAHRATADWLAAGATALPHPERFLSLHRHVRTAHVVRQTTSPHGDCVHLEQGAA
jgi:NTE family protein